jgi:hypothetical protein
MKKFNQVQKKKNYFFHPIIIFSQYELFGKKCLKLKIILENLKITNFQNY